MRAIVVGSHKEPHWFGKLSGQLAGFGVEIVAHWPDKNSAKRMSGLDKAETILVTKDCCCHSLFSMVREMKLGKRIICISHRKAENQSILSNYH